MPDVDRFVDITASLMQWRPDAPFHLDVAEFQTALAQAQQANASAQMTALARAVDLYAGDLLPGCYDDWILPVRERLALHFLHALESLILILEERKEYMAAIGYAQRLLRHDPLHEATYGRLMQLHAAAGDRVAALRVYHTCASILERELGVVPSASTCELYEQLLHAESGKASPPPMRGAPFVGRRDEWQTLQQLWSNAQNGNPRFACIIGEAGMNQHGKIELLMRGVLFPEAPSQRGLAGADIAKHDGKPHPLRDGILALG